MKEEEQQDLWSPWTRRAFLVTGLVSITGVAYGLQRGPMYPQNRWFGIFVPGKKIADFDALADTFAVRPSVAGYFVRFNSDFTDATLARFGDRGLTPFLTLEPWRNGMRPMVMDPTVSLETINAGTYDEDLRRIASVIRNFAKPVFLRLGHEMNGHWYPWAVGSNGNTPEQYLQFWRHVREVMAEADNIRWVWACAAIHSLRRTAPNIDTLFPGDDLVDLAGTTGYGWDKNAKATYGKTFARLSTLTDRDFVIPEMGAQQGTNHFGATPVTWTESFGTYLLDNPRIRGFVWFHIDPSIGATGDYKLSDPETLEAFNELLTEVPITSNTAMTKPDGQLTVLSARDAVNPTTAVYAYNIVNGHACDAKGPTRGFDKFGNMYECYIHPKGWNRWRKLPKSQ